MKELRDLKDLTIHDVQQTGFMRQPGVVHEVQAEAPDASLLLLLLYSQA